MKANTESCSSNNCACSKVKLPGIYGSVVKQQEEIKHVGLYKYRINGLDCATCGKKIEKALSQLPELSDVSIDFMKLQLTFNTKSKDIKIVEKHINQVMDKVESGVSLAINETKESHQPMNMLLVGGFILYCSSFLVETTSMMYVVAMLLSYALLGYDIIKKALSNVLKGKLFDENFLMAIATVAAMLLNDYREAVSVLLFYQVGEWFQDRAVEKSRESISSLMDIRPDIAHVLHGKNIVDKRVEDVVLNDMIQVKPGERIPMDGIVVSGVSSLDVSSLTGESMEQEVVENSSVMSGSVNKQGLLTIRVTSLFKDSTVSKILQLVEHSESSKAKPEKFITKFAEVYTPIVIALATFTAIFLPLMDKSVTYSDSLYRAATFLVLSCPCALVISIPLAFFAGIGGLSKNGILVKGSTVIEACSKINHVVFDKTGTITEGVFEVVNSIGDIDGLFLAALAESSSTHPIARSICLAYGKDVPLHQVTRVEEMAGFGIKIDYLGDSILVGSYKLMEKNNIKNCVKYNGNCVYVAKNKEWMTTIVLEDKIKQEALKTMKDIRSLSVDSITLLTGDMKDNAMLVGEHIGVDSVISDCLPHEKVAYVQSLKEKGIVSFIGDGINDAPVLSMADVGFSMGLKGSDAAIEASDIVIMDDDISKVYVALKRSKKIMMIVMENIVFSIAIKVIVMALGFFGYASMWLAIFADVGVAILAILNSIRLIKK